MNGGGSGSLAALIRIQLRIQLTSPIVLSVLLVLVLFRISSTWQQMPVWPEVLTDTSFSLLALGVGTMLTTNVMLLRESSPGMRLMLAAHPMSSTYRFCATVLSAGIAATAVGTISVSLQVGSLLVGSVPVGPFSFQEIVTGLTAAMLLTMLGAALALWIPSPIAAPVAVAVIFWLTLQFPDSWLLPSVPDQGELLFAPRPPGWHLWYLVCACCALAAAGFVRLRRSVIAVTTVVASVVGVGVLGAATLSAPENRTYTLALAELGSGFVTDQSTLCRTINDQTYCAITEFEPWIPLWQQAVDPVLAALPTQVRSAIPDIVQQRPTGYLDPQRNYLPVGINWGRNGGQVNDVRALAGQVAAAAVGLPSGNSVTGIDGCSGVGQSRTVVALWLVGQSTPPAVPATSERTVEIDGQAPTKVLIPDSELGRIAYGDTEVDLAVAMLGNQSAAAGIAAHWDRLVAPETSIDELVRVIGMSMPAGQQLPDRELCR